MTTAKAQHEADGVNAEDTNSANLDAEVNMADNQIQFIIWLITTAIDKCQTIEEVRQLDEEIRIHSKGLVGELSERKHR